jgi:hypothetical protein
VTFWTYYQTVTADPLSPAEYAHALHRLHAGMRRVEVATPHFMTRAAEAEQLLYDVAWENDVEGVDLQVAQNAAVLGDGVYKVLWEPAAGRVRILSVDPRTFFAKSVGITID